jgi:hypothetical protein
MRGGGAATDHAEHRIVAIAVAHRRVDRRMEAIVCDRAVSARTDIRADLAYGRSGSS